MAKLDITHHELELCILSLRKHESNKQPLTQQNSISFGCPRCKLEKPNTGGGNCIAYWCVDFKVAILCINFFFFSLILLEPIWHIKVPLNVPAFCHVLFQPNIFPLPRKLHLKPEVCVACSKRTLQIASVCSCVPPPKTCPG